MEWTFDGPFLCRVFRAIDSPGLLKPSTHETLREDDDLEESDAVKPLPHMKSSDGYRDRRGDTSSTELSVAVS